MNPRSDFWIVGARWPFWTVLSVVVLYLAGSL
jgi:hypothetical protein